MQKLPNASWSLAAFEWVFLLSTVSRRAGLDSISAAPRFLLLHRIGQRELPPLTRENQKDGDQAVRGSESREPVVLQLTAHWREAAWRGSRRLGHIQRHHAHHVWRVHDYSFHSDAYALRADEKNLKGAGESASAPWEQRKVIGGTRPCSVYTWENLR